MKIHKAMWTDRFIKVPVRIYNIEHKDLTGQELLEDSWEKLDPLEISNYRPSYGNEEDGEKCTNIVLKNKDSILAYLPIKDFEKLLNEHQQ